MLAVASIAVTFTEENHKYETEVDRKKKRMLERRGSSFQLPFAFKVEDDKEIEA